MDIAQLVKYCMKNEVLDSTNFQRILNSITIKAVPPTPPPPQQQQPQASVATTHGAALAQGKSIRIPNPLVATAAEALPPLEAPLAAVAALPATVEEVSPEADASAVVERAAAATASKTGGSKKKRTVTIKSDVMPKTVKGLETRKKLLKKRIKKAEKKVKLNKNRVIKLKGGNGNNSKLSKRVTFSLNTSKNK